MEQRCGSLVIKVTGAPLFHFLSDILQTTTRGTRGHLSCTGCLLENKAFRLTFCPPLLSLVEMFKVTSSFVLFFKAAEQIEHKDMQDTSVDLLSRNLRPSQLLGGDLCRTEFMVHLFGTIRACKSRSTRGGSHRCPPRSSTPDLSSPDRASNLVAPITPVGLRLHDTIEPFLLPRVSFFSGGLQLVLVLSGSAVLAAGRVKRRMAAEDQTRPDPRTKDSQQHHSAPQQGKVQAAPRTSCKFLLRCRPVAAELAG